MKNFNGNILGVNFWCLKRIYKNGNYCGYIWEANEGDGQVWGWYVGCTEGILIFVWRAINDKDNESTIRAQQNFLYLSIKGNIGMQCKMLKRGIRIGQNKVRWTFGDK